MQSQKYYTQMDRQNADLERDNREGEEGEHCAEPDTIQDLKPSIKASKPLLFEPLVAPTLNIQQIANSTLCAKKVPRWATPQWENNLKLMFFLSIVNEMVRRGSLNERLIYLGKLIAVLCFRAKRIKSIFLNNGHNSR